MKHFRSTLTGTTVRKQSREHFPGSHVSITLVKTLPGNTARKYRPQMPRENTARKYRFKIHAKPLPKTLPDNVFEIDCPERLPGDTVRALTVHLLSLLSRNCAQFTRKFPRDYRAFPHAFCGLLLCDFHTLRGRIPHGFRAIFLKIERIFVQVSKTFWRGPRVRFCECFLRLPCKFGWSRSGFPTTEHANLGGA